MATVIPKVKLGSQGLVVSQQGLGCMGMSGNYGLPKPEADMIKLIHHAIDSGVTFLDTSDVYGPHTNEILVGKALKEGGLREKVQIATKFAIRHVDGKMDVCGDPAYVRSACEASLKRLDIDCIDLYYVHRIDIRVPIEVTMGELKKLVEEGKVKYVGLSEASASTIRRAHAVHPLTAVQNEWSIWSRDLEEDIVPTCRELGIGIVPYSPIGRGFLAVGPKLAENLTDGDFRKSHPRFQNAEQNKSVFERVNEIATRKGCTPAQLALAWVHHQGSDVVPIPGTTKIENFNQNIGALSVKLTPEEMAELELIASSDMVKGERHAFMQLTWINSETPPLSSWKAIHISRLSNPRQPPMSSSLELSIRPFRVTDADDFFSLARDDRVTQYLRWNTMKDREEALKYLKEVVIPHPWRRSICFDDKSIGYISVKPESGVDRHRAHISYAIGVDFWGRGITTAAMKMAIPMVFQEMSYVVRIEALVKDENKASQNVLGKLGFKKEGYLRKYGFNKGEIRDMIMYSLLSADLSDQIC